MNVYPDTSTVIKRYHKEVGSAELLAVLRAHAHDLILTVADITRTEFHLSLRIRLNTMRLILLICFELVT